MLTCLGRCYTHWILVHIALVAVQEVENDAALKVNISYHIKFRGDLRVLLSSTRCCCQCVLKHPQVKQQQDGLCPNTSS